MTLGFGDDELAHEHALRELRVLLDELHEPKPS